MDICWHDWWAFLGQTPLEFHAQYILKTGLVATAEDGIFTREQMKEMQEISQRGSGGNKILHHIAMGVESNSEKKSFTERFFGTSSPVLDPILQKAYEAASAPWPYNLIAFIPSWIRVVVIIFAVLLLFRCCGETLQKLLHNLFHQNTISSSLTNSEWGMNRICPFNKEQRYRMWQHT